MSKLSKRQFMKLSLGTAVAAPLLSRSPVSGEIASDLIDNTGQMFGYSFGDGFYPETGFPSMAAARQAAISAIVARKAEFPEKRAIKFKVSEVDNIAIDYPQDYGEIVLNWLAEEDPGLLGDQMLDELAGCNGDGDYEGEFSVALLSISAYDPMMLALNRSLADSTAAAIDRAGSPIIAEWIRARHRLSADNKYPEDLPWDNQQINWDTEENLDLIDRISKDKVFAEEMTAALKKIVDAKDLEMNLNGLTVGKTYAFQVRPAGEARIWFDEKMKNMTLESSNGMLKCKNFEELKCKHFGDLPKFSMPVTTVREQPIRIDADTRQNPADYRLGDYVVIPDLESEKVFFETRSSDLSSAAQTDPGFNYRQESDSDTTSEERNKSPETTVPEY